MQEKAPKTANIRKMRPFMLTLKPLHTITLGQKLKLQKKVPKTTLNPEYSRSMQKTVPKNNECSKNEAILKIDKNGQYAKAIAFPNCNIGSKIKIAKKLPKTIRNPDYSCAMQEKAPKNNEDSKNETILKIDKNNQYAKAIAFAKLSFWVEY